ncbi:MAG: hypothetical protein WCB68_06405 [Pyrinomonadaceae bacterium]
MSKSLTPVEGEKQGWVVSMTPEMARVANVPEGSYIVFYLRDGSVAAEILPPTSPEIKEIVKEISDEFHEAFAEMKRLGD